MDPGPPAPQPEPVPEPARDPVGGGDPAAAPTPATPPSAPAPQPDVAAAEEQKRAGERAVAQEEARERAAEQRAAAAERAAAQQVQASWEGRGRPNLMVVVRSRRVDLVTAGRLTRQVPRPAGAMTLSALHRYLPENWLSISDGVARLSAAVVLTPGTSLDVGGDVTALELAGGATSSEAASIYSGSGRLKFTGVAVGSADTAFRQEVPPSPGRPFVVVSAGGRLDAVDSSFSDLGTEPTAVDDRAAVVFNAGSSGSLVRTAFVRNGTGVKLARSENVRLEGVTVAESAGDGLVLNGDRGTALIGVRVAGNGGNGVVVGGESTDRPITGITTEGNRLFGVVLIRQVNPRISGVVTARDGTGGLRISQSTGVVVTDHTATDEPIGVYTHVGSSRIVLDRLRITGGRRGITVEKTTEGLEVTASTIDRATVAGIGVGGHDVALRDVVIEDSQTGVRVERGAYRVTATGLTLSGGEDGVVALSGTSGVVLRDVVATGVSNDAVRTFSENAQIIGGRITGSGTGIDIGAATTISGTAITEVDEGIRTRTGEPVHVDGIDVSALSAGINAAAGSAVILVDSRVDALQAVRGEVNLQGLNELSLPPLNLLGAIGVPLILLALILEQVHAFRQRSLHGAHRRLAPNLRTGAG